MSPPAGRSPRRHLRQASNERPTLLAELVTGRRAHTLESLPAEEGNQVRSRRNWWLASDLGLIVSVGAGRTSDKVPEGLSGEHGQIGDV